MRFSLHRWHSDTVPHRINSTENEGKKVRMALCAIALILCSLGMCACQKGESTDSTAAAVSATTEKAIAEVETAEVTQWRSDIQQRFSGVVRPHKRALLSTRMNGTLTHLHVTAGDEVEAGALLAQVDARDIVAALDAAQAQLDAAQSAHAKAQLDVQRLERLYSEDLIARNRLERAQVERDNSKAALEQARTQVRLQQTNLEYVRISAPFDGDVSEVPMDEGSFVGPGTTLVILEDRSSFRIDVPISARAANSLKTNNPHSLVKTPSMSQARVATYQDVIPSMEKGGIGQILRLHLEAADDEIRPGQIAEVVLETMQPEQTSKDTASGATATMIPRSALIRQGQLASVMLVTAVEEDSRKDPSYRVQKRWVVTASVDIRSQPAPTSEAIVKVLQGLTPGEHVVINPSPAMSSGQAVNLATETD
jgi:RND family efflux transporter MFP subunit